MNQSRCSLQTLMMTAFLAVIMTFIVSVHAEAQSKSSKKKTSPAKSTPAATSGTTKNDAATTSSDKSSKTSTDASSKLNTESVPAPTTGGTPTTGGSPTTGGTPAIITPLPISSVMPTFQAATRLPENAAPRPKAAVGFIDANVSLPTTTGTLYGTLTVPNNASSTATVPFVLLLNTNTVFDRNGHSHNNRDSSMHLKYLAEALAKQGIASLRYDTRGVAKSMTALKGEDHLDFEKTVTDAAGWITQVRKDNRFSTISVFGISLPNDYGREASLAAILTVNRMNADGLLCVGADSRKYVAMIRGKAAMAYPAHTAGYVDSLAQLMEQGKRFDLKPSDGIAYNLFRPSVQPYVLALNKFDPRMEMAKVKVPSVIVHGSMDYSIPIEVVATLAASNPQAQFVSIKNMSFFLKNGNDDFATPALQKHKLPVMQEFVNLATEYVFSVNKVQ